ncbi:PREDICTED: bidirectional sugar transporter SWEET16-like [Tarenaya hassleriana]|uniref:bidirectional sugar transporter SWEET16-like n=1 Tax=Tarenaya hassleriana TaxID=28532 RepID=UPI0008FD86A9|nr:PREDICTED: bidirectional sugar transporter SWEET16-like [Tarenaya hassleriana]
MLSLVVLFGLLGNLTTGLVYISPLKTFWHIIERRSTEEFESLPYVCKLLNAYQWVYYGVIKPNSVLVATVNGFGAVCEIIFLIIFLIFASSPSRRMSAGIMVGVLDVVFPGAAVLVMQFMMEGETRINAAGFMSLTFSMVCYGSPLSAMKTVVTTKSVEYMPFLLSFFLFINGGVWTTYAFLTADWFIGIPNGVGFLLGTAQMVLYATYWKPKPKHTSLSPSCDLSHDLLSKEEA